MITFSNNQRISLISRLTIFYHFCSLSVLIIVLLSLPIVTLASQNGKPTESLTNEKSTPKGHLQPFGVSGTCAEIEVRKDFPTPRDFLFKYVKNSKPFKLEGVMKDSRAAKLWSDKYLLALHVPEDSTVSLEKEKKENRSLGVEDVHFHEFLRIYNHSDYYMVDDVPPYLRPDITVPCSLQCQEILDRGFAFAMMWFSSGGTKSVVHTDAFENIICLYRGQKTFVMMDPVRDREKIDLDNHEAYSKMDVDRVDLTQYPGLVDGVFYHVNLTAGDCMYIPYRWIHQVRSYNSNVAVNFWWGHHDTMKLLQGDKKVCQGQCDPTLTLDKVELLGDGEESTNIEAYRDWLIDTSVNSPKTRDELFNLFTRLPNEYMGVLPPHLKKTISAGLKKIFKLLDVNQDGRFTTEDLSSIPEKALLEVREMEQALTSAVEKEEQRLQEEKPNPAAFEARQEL